MKTLVFKELCENAKLAALGLIIYALLLLAQYREYIATPGNMVQPLAHPSLHGSTAWFCCIFGAVLGWLQLYNERRPDLWAFLIHRPMTRTEIFLGKVLAGFGLYAVVVGAPLASFVIWDLLPGHVAAPFELRMLRPVVAFVLTGLVFYLAGMLTGLRQARWYASRALGLGMALIVCMLMQFRPTWWEGFLIILVGALILFVVVWSGFQSHGYYRGQPVWGKAALTFALTLGSLLVAVVAAVLLSNLFPGMGRTGSWSHYAMTQDGAIYKVTQTLRQPAEIVDLGGKPLLDATNGHKVDLREFNRQLAPILPVNQGRSLFARAAVWTLADTMLAVGWHSTSDTLWYYWRRYGRMVGYDINTRRCIGSLGPQGFAHDLVGGGDRVR